MVDLNALERQLADESLRILGPARPVDDGAIFTAVTAIRSPKWRVQPMFSALKFVLAGAIVALFGGFLLSGVLTQPSEEPVHGVGASPSVQAEPTASAPPATIRSDLLPGVELTVEQVAPSVFRVLDDGAGHELDPIWQVASTPEGGAWILAADHGSAFSPRVYRLGEPGAFTTADGIPGLADGLRVGADGRLYAHASGDDAEWTVLDDGAWVDTTEREAFTYRLSPDDGTSWEITNLRPVELGIVRHDRSGTSEYGLHDMHLDGLEDYGNFMSEAIDPKALALAPDGRVWSLWSARHGNGAPPGLGLAEFDGTSWRDITPDQWRIGSPEARNEGGRPGSIFDATLSVASDGTLRVAADVHDTTIPGLDETGWIPARRVEASWDGDRWTIESRTSWDLASIATKIAGFGVPSPGVVGPDGTMLLNTARSPRSPDLYVVRPESVAVGDEDVFTMDVTTTPDLLPGVALVTEEVEPGVYRVLSDGVRELDHDNGPSDQRPDSIQSLMFGHDGSLWAWTDRELHRVGADEPIETLARFYTERDIVLGPDGTPWGAWADGCGSVQPPRIGSHDGHAWRLHSEGVLAPLSGPDPRWPPDSIGSLAIGHDGSAWGFGSNCGGTEHASLVRLGPDGWTVYSIGDGLPDWPCGPDCGGGWTIEITPDGAIWLGVPEGGLLRYDGADWQTVRPLGGDEDHGVVALASNGDGVLWAEMVADDTSVPGGSQRFLARLDESAWEAFPYEPDGLDFGPRIHAVAPDGAVWLTDAFTEQDQQALAQDIDLLEYRFTSVPVSFDGEQWSRYPQVLADWATDPVHELDRWGRMRESFIGVELIALGPDGTAWSVVSLGNLNGGREGLYAITSEAVAASERASGPDQEGGA